MTKATVELGDRVKDAVTGFEGVAVCKTDWLHGCQRIGVQSDIMHEGKPVEVQYFDTPALHRIMTSPKKVEKITGGLRTPPGRHTDPRR